MAAQKKLSRTGGFRLREAAGARIKRSTGGEGHLAA
jgi:hypothetical protein